MEDFLITIQKPLLLKQFYLKTNRFAEGASILITLAGSEQMELQQKIENLVEAKSLLSISTPMTEKVKTLLHEVEERIDVAKIQLEIYVKLMTFARPEIQIDIK